MNPIHHGHRRPSRLRTACLALATAALCAPLLLTAAGGPSAAEEGVDAPATAAAPAPRLHLSAPKRQVVYAEGKRLYTDLGVRMVAQGADLRLDLNRADYSSPIVVSRRDAAGGSTELGTDLTNSFNQLDRFVRLRFTPLKTSPKAKASYTRVRGACLGSVSERIRPDADPRSPYPTYCNYNPYSLGAVQGISDGYAASVLEPWGRMKGVPKGRYRVEVRVTKAWADALNMSATDRVRTTTVRIRSYEDCDRGCRRSVPRPPSDTPTPSASRPNAQRALDPAEVPADYPKPDLRALPAWGLQISGNGNYLQFSATVWNGGNSPLVVDGFRRGGKDLMDGYQYFFDADGQQLPDYARVGEFEWDPKPTHLHWHFRSFAAYSLLPVGHTPEAPDGHDDHHGVQSRKEAFCLANTDAVDLTGDGAQWNVENSDLATACGDHTSLSIREVLAAGWGDTYAQFRAGQSFNLKGLPNGCYNVWVEGNPILDHETGDRTLVESDYSNNTAKRRVCIGGKPGARKIRHLQQIGDVDENDRGEYYRR
ncbi:hypothetical protein FXB39_07690 [Nocardioides sp. BGMRC 2183]|nr:hypothetical protein FXB39_07690 [Nocardioides sp. BGMRC 2183]